MSWLRTLFLFQILRNTKETAKASRNQQGEPICGDCRTHVHSQATKCSGCGSNLYTTRGKMTRNLLSIVGVLMIFGAVISESAVGLLGVIPGVLLLFMWWSLRKDAPNRELHLKQHIPFVGGTEENNTEYSDVSRNQQQYQDQQNRQPHGQNANLSDHQSNQHQQSQSHQRQYQ